MQELLVLIDICWRNVSTFWVVLVLSIVSLYRSGQPIHELLALLSLENIL